MKQKLQIIDLDVADWQQLNEWWHSNCHRVTNKYLPAELAEQAYVVNLTDLGMVSHCGGDFTHIIVWCYFCCEGRFNFQGSTSDFKFWFEKESDAVMFKLTWGYKYNPVIPEFEDDEAW